MSHLLSVDDAMLYHCKYAGVPEIPHIIDVLYALRLTERQYVYDFCAANHPIYLENVHLVAAAVVAEVHRGLKVSTFERRALQFNELLYLIAATIVVKSPPDAEIRAAYQFAKKLVNYYEQFQAAKAA